MIATAAVQLDSWRNEIVMRKLMWMVFGVAIGAGGMWYAMHNHVLRTNSGLAMVPKFRAQLSGTYFDVRDWGVTEWTEHPDLVLTLEKNQRTDIIGDAKIFGTTLRDATNLLK
jgi:hypothetical protein